MGSRIPSHQLSNGLYVSGLPEQQKERQPTMASKAMPYTGGDVKKSGELGKMFDIPVVDPAKPRLSATGSSGHNSGSLPSGSNFDSLAPPPQSNSGPLARPPQSNSGSLSKKSSGPLSGRGTPVFRQHSGSNPLSLPPTGLITSGPVSSRPLNSSGGPRRPPSGQLEPSGSMGKLAYGAAVTNLGEEQRIGFKVSKPIIWVFVVVFLMGLMFGVCMLVTLKKAVVLILVGGSLVPLIAVLGWNCACGRKGVVRFLAKYPDAELRGAKDGQFVKITGVVTCGRIPLESSYQRVTRCIYISTGLYEYRGWSEKPANPKHRRFSWGMRHLERHVGDFYISDVQSGLRALVKAGYGAKVSSFVKPMTVVDITKENRELCPSFVRWLAERNLSSDDRVMHLEEGYIKEGNTVSVMGIVQRHDNVLMIIPPAEPVSMGCQWGRCLLPTDIKGLVLTCDESSSDVIPV